MCFRNASDAPSITPVCYLLDKLYEFTGNFAQQYKARKAWLKDAHLLANNTLNALDRVYERAKEYDHQSWTLTGTEISTLVGSFVKATRNWQVKAEELPGLLVKDLFRSKKCKAQINFRQA